MNSENEIYSNVNLQLGRLQKKELINELHVMFKTIYMHTFSLKT